MDTSADYTVTRPPGGFSGFATFRFSAGAANDSAIREEDERVGQRWILSLFCTGENYKTAMRGAQETAAMFVATVDHLLSTIFTCPRQMRDSASSDKRLSI